MVVKVLRLFFYSTAVLLRQNQFWWATTLDSEGTPGVPKGISHLATHIKDTCSSHTCWVGMNAHLPQLNRGRDTTCWQSHNTTSCYCQLFYSICINYSLLYFSLFWSHNEAHPYSQSCLWNRANMFIFLASKHYFLLQILKRTLKGKSSFFISYMSYHLDSWLQEDDPLPPQFQLSPS